MLKIIGNALLSCTLILVTVLIHKIIYRLLFLNHSSLALYWGMFLAVFFILQVAVNLCANTFTARQPR